MTFIKSLLYIWTMKSIDKVKGLRYLKFCGLRSPMCGWGNRSKNFKFDLISHQRARSQPTWHPDHSLLATPPLWLIKLPPVYLPFTSMARHPQPSMCKSTPQGPQQLFSQPTSCQWKVGDLKEILSLKAHNSLFSWHCNWIISHAYNLKTYLYIEGFFLGGVFFI